MKIYTKTGDLGETGLYGGRRVAKDSLRVTSIGNVDEVNASIGRAMGSCSHVSREFLSNVQRDLFKLGCDLATPVEESVNARLEGAFPKALVRIEVTDVLKLEEKIDEVEEKLEPLRRFIMPGGSAAGSELHLARTVARRAERSVVLLAKAEKVNSEALVYLNRLSDLLFVLARFENKLSGAKEEEWVP